MDSNSLVRSFSELLALETGACKGDDSLTTKFSAFVLVNVEAGKAFAVRDKIDELPNTSFTYCVTGAYDVITKVEADTFDEIVRDLVVGRIQAIRGVTQTMTCLVVSEK